MKEGDSLKELGEGRNNWRMKGTGDEGRKPLMKEGNSW